MNKNLFRISAVALFASVAIILSTVLCPYGYQSDIIIGQKLWVAQLLPVATLCAFAGMTLQYIVQRRFHDGSSIAVDLEYMVQWTLIIMGGLEAVLGLCQLFGYARSGHSLYAMTGSFFNPGPYGGYLAIVLPICLYVYQKGTKWEQVIVAIVGMLIFSVLPATMSRAAMIAAMLGCCHVWLANKDRQWMRALFIRRKRLFVSIGAVLLIVFALLAILFTCFKMDSALGRLFLWKISLMAVCDNPFGYEGGFVSAFNTTQEAYFASGDFQPWEERVAGCPAYAFNEFLQCAIEHGVVVLFLVLFVVVLCFCKAHRDKRFGINGAIISFMIFAFASYPLYFPAFRVTGILLLMACWKPAWHWLLMLLLAMSFIYIDNYDKRWKDEYEACQRWESVRMLYRSGAYGAAIESYKQLYPFLNCYGSFLFEYGHSLHKTQHYHESIAILKEAEKHITDPMVLNIIGKDYQALGLCQEGETYYLRSSYRLPNRIYPYYLLAKLYASKEFLNKAKFLEMKRIVFYKKPKVMSSAIREMRNELRRIEK